MKKQRFLLFLLLGLMASLLSSCTTKDGEFPLFAKGDIAQIYVSSSEAPQILRAVGDLQNDIEMVTGQKPEIIYDISEADDHLIIIGQEKAAVMKQLYESGHLAEAKGMKGMHEAFLFKSISKPFENIKNALVVAGSDANGTVYGIYEISERIGVSPMYWWADIQPRKQDKVVLSDCLMLPVEPSVKYRGIFINDEEAMTQWSERTSPNEYDCHPSPEVYKRVFELLLRLKANAIWPAMMQRSAYFFEAKEADGTPVNARNAKEYGIYVGSSHCEQMARNNFAEWHDWAEEHANMYDAKGVPVWDYTVNPKTIEAYWQERINESKDYNMIYTLGIRGVHDSPFLYENMKNPTLEKKVALLQHVIDRQREMIKETFGSEDAVPQVFIPYEEAAELYNGETTDGREKCEGIKLPEDVMMVWTEDNFAFARQLPGEKELNHPGGNGLYYHLAYQGWPTTYDWLTTTPLTIVQEQLRKVYDSNARKIWMVNVGDVKPAEMSLQFFMSLAYDIDSYPKNTTKEFMKKSAKQQFDIADDVATDFADIMTDFQSLCWPKKPEPMVPFWSWEFEKDWMYTYYSYANYGDAAQRQINKAIALEKRAKKMYDSLDEDRKIPFWHLSYYPIRSTRLMLEKAEYYRKNIAYAKQGRYASVNAYKALSENAEAAIQKDLATYETMVDGKWNGIMDPYANYNDKERLFDVANIPNNLVYDELFKEEEGKGIGSVCEGQKLGTEKVVLRFSSLEDNERFVDVFNKALDANNWKIDTDVEWLKFSKAAGAVRTEERVIVNIDWAKAPVGDNKATFTVKDDLGYAKSYSVLATKFDIELKEKSYVEGNGYLVVEAENYTNKHDAKASWVEYDNYGFDGSTMFLKGGDKVDYKDGAYLEYSVYFATAGTHYAELFRIPTLNEGQGKTNDIAIGLNDQTPQILSGVRKKKESKRVKLSDGSVYGRNWINNVLMLMEKIPFEVTVDKPGYHTLRVSQINTNIGIDKIVICTEKQAAIAQRDALIGALESYNTFGNYKSVEVAQLPQLDELATVRSFQKQEAFTNVNFNFAMYSMIDELDFIPVNQRHAYDENRRSFGWRPSDIKNIGSFHNESVETIPFWQRDGLKGKKEAKFYAKLKPGKYNITYYMGDPRKKKDMLYSKGINFKMSFAINGKQLMKNEDVITGHQKIDDVDVVISEGELLEVTVSGNWILNALEIVKK